MRSSILLAVILVFGACTKKPDAAPASTTAKIQLAKPPGEAAPQPSPAHVVVPALEPATPAPAPSSPPAAIAADPNISPSSQPETSLKGGEPATPQVIAEYNRKLARVIFELSDYPSSLEQLKSWPRMPKLPTPPPGKRIAYDARTKTIYVVQ